MKITPKGFYTDIRRQLQADAEELAERGIYVTPEELADEFRRRACAERTQLWARREKIAGHYFRIALGTAGALMLFGSAGGLSLGSLDVRSFIGSVVAGIVMIALALKWQEWAT